MVNALWLLPLLAVAPQEPASPAPRPRPTTVAEARFVAIEDVPLPADVVLEVGGMVVRSEALFVATRRGEIWRLDDAGGARPRPSLWAEGLQEPLGLVDHDGWLWCAQRGELSRMRDRDGDGRMDELETVADGWPLSGNYHEYLFGPARAGDGSWWLTTNKPFGEQPFGRAPWRGWALRVPPEGGAFEPVAAGLRSPAGVGTAPDGTVWFTDNQGEWCAAGKFAPLAVGDFHGHPWGIDSCRLPGSRVAHPGDVERTLRHDELERLVPHYRPPAVWIPYDRCGRSPTGFVWDTEGRFGPFRGQVFCGDQFSCEVFRLSVERVAGRWQGACYPFRGGLKCGVTRFAWATGGALWCGLSDRGWGSQGQAGDGLQRLVWRGQTPFELLEVTASADGFRLRFTAPVAAASVVPASFAVRSWTYDHCEDYGCPPRDERAHAVRATAVAAETVELALDVAATGRVYEVRCPGVRGADPAAPAPWHGVAWYTRNAAPR